jgi:hypothetical protein
MENHKRAMLKFRENAKNKFLKLVLKTTKVIRRIKRE